MQPPREKNLHTGVILLIIVLAQFFGTSVWFATNAVLGEITRIFDLPADALGTLTSSVQFGFIAGTLVFAILHLADRYLPSRIFFVCALVAAASNLAVLWADGFTSLLLLRILTGLSLAGIYPVGMKIAADHHEKGLGRALGFLVGALVIGTSFPHLLTAFTGLFNWEAVLIWTSVLAAAGGILILLLVPAGPFRKPGGRMRLRAVWQVFRIRNFRAAAFGYFGHMWELYTFWAFIPVILATYRESHAGMSWPGPLLSFLVVFLGFPACVAGGYISGALGSFRTARAALFISMVCCLCSPLFFQLPEPVFLALVAVWSMAVIADSPQFSTLVANAAPAESRGTALTLVNCIGFSITIVSIMALTWLKAVVPPERLYLFLAPGPVLGLFAMRRSTDR